MNKQKNVISLTTLQKTILIDILKENKEKNEDNIRHLVISDLLNKLGV